MEARSVTTKTTATVVTACGKRKSREPSPALLARGLAMGDAASVAAQWAVRLQEAPERVPARELYQGRAFREAEIAAAPRGSPMYVLSAGLGLIPVDVEIPSYSLTVAEGADNILRRLSGTSDSCASAWWSELSRVPGCRSFGDLAATSSGPVLIAAGSSYLAMIAQDLGSLSPSTRQRLRIFTASPQHSVPSSLRDFVMPYDQRLEALPDRSGTMSDFAQRALRHFAEVILPMDPGGTHEVHAATVSAALEGKEAPVRKRGRTMSDEEIKGIIQANWARTGGKSAATLRLLRDSLGVGCEQCRFKRLFAEARADVTA
jgi:hypothetical protein